MNFTLADVIGNQRRIEQYFHHRGSSFTVFARQQLLSDHGFEVQGQVHPHLVMHVGREKALYPIQGLVGIIGVQCTQAQVPGFGESQGLLHGLGSPHLTNQYHVRRLAQGVFQRHIKGLGIHTHLALGNQATRMLVHEFDGVLDTDNVAATIVVAITQHRRQRGGFTGAGGTDKDDQATLGHGQFLDNGR